jgi:DNA-binding NarL/FixJ family response regulator
MDMELSGVAGSASEAFELIRSDQPNVVVVDISLGDAHGLDLVQNLRAQYPELEVVVFSMYDEDVYAERAIRAGARAYVMKSEPTSSVAEAIRAVAQGEIYLNRRAASRLLNRMAGVRGTNSSRASDRGLEELTDREMAVFQMLGQGHSIDNIASQLNMARRVGVALSSQIAGPMLIGVIKPLILIPTGLVNRLSPRHMEMVLAHELAHLYRADHLVNLFQNIVETLLFYHPVVRWVSNQIRAERDITIMLVEHDMQAVMGLCGRITVMNFGRLLAEGTPEEIRADEEVVRAYLGTPGDAA